jgi:predicted nuclease of predicted toxin-antitoxin system
VKLLLDQNISFRLVKKIEGIFPESEQVRRIGLENKNDRIVWEFAKREKFTIVTFDSDFYDLSLLLGRPPQLIWIKTSDQTTKNLERLLYDRAADIQDFITSNELNCLEIID